MLQRPLGPVAAAIRPVSPKVPQCPPSVAPARGPHHFAMARAAIGWLLLCARARVCALLGGPTFKAVWFAGATIQVLVHVAQPTHTHN